MTDKPLPASQDSEMALVASVLIEPKHIDEIRSVVSGADFFDSQAGKLYETLCDLHDTGFPIGDVVAVYSKLKTAGFAITPGELKTLIETGIHWHAKHYAMEIRRTSLLRRFQGVATAILDKTSNKNADPNEIAAWAESKLFIGDLEREQVKMIGEAASEVLDELEQRTQRRGLMTGIQVVDEKVGMLRPGEMAVIAARPGNGKTTIATQMCIFNAENGKQVLFVSLEMSQKELALRQMCCVSGVNQRLVRSEMISPEERGRLVAAASEIYQLPMAIYAPRAATMAQIMAIARLRKNHYGLDLIVIDYIGLVRVTGEAMKLQRRDQISEITKSIKRMARELDIPAIALCQLNREADKAVPNLGMLRESGAIEEDADMVFFLHRPNPESDSNAVEEMSFIVAKHRHGPTGNIKLYWDRKTTSFDSYGPIEQSPNYTPAFNDFNSGSF